MRINEDFLDAVDSTETISNNVEATVEEEQLTPEEYNKKYAHEYTHMIVLFREMPNNNATEDIPKVAELYERILDRFYPEHSPIQIVYTSKNNVYARAYEAAGAQFEEAGPGHALISSDYHNTVRFKSCVNTYDVKNEVKTFLNFAALMNKLAYKTVGAQIGGHVEVYIADVDSL